MFETAPQVTAGPFFYVLIHPAIAVQRAFHMRINGFSTGGACFARACSGVSGAKIGGADGGKYVNTPKCDAKSHLPLAVCVSL
ncbi:hypothetical protein NBRC116596_09210 [Litorivita sp. NS0012-18]